ncbi:MAG: GNAT family N-acetyltransferase [Nocardioides sp.]|uniref:GNAT family N-acetyltransferase n=1 Tax=Nocardioides sp. TaxID=35761 RepID=UPI0039E3F9AD
MSGRPRREIRRAGRTDPVGQVIAAAFGEHGPAVAELWAEVVGLGLDRASLVAVEQGAVVGHVGVSHAWLDARRALVDVLVLSPLSVTPPRQRTGIGTALLAAAIGAAEAYGAPALFLEGDPGYYRPRGFRPAAEAGFEAPSRRIPAPAFQVVLFGAHRPWMTGRVVYREVWWRHDSTGLRDPALAEVEAALGPGSDPS